ncbi:DEAD/DEAH box helicase [Haladaptatus sp. ZSTT2]|uniref:DEAD/DEAH box helicase n=1 Tax=Haladaptatus sp. ZSTT2 TaxID=3120515 RepID=UPI00300EE9D7
MVSSGFIRRESRKTEGEDGERTEQFVSLWPTGSAWLDAELDFADFIWQSLKRGWVLEANAPEKIEAIERVLHALIHAEKPLGKSDIEYTLREDYNYSFNKLGVRGYPELLVLLGAIEKDDSTAKYTPTEAAETYLNKFRQADLFRIYERWIRREGATGDLPKSSVKRDMMKYYMYRESGGMGKQTAWLKPFWREFLSADAREGNTVRPQLQRSADYMEARTNRKDLRREIKQIHGIESQLLSGLSTDVLKRIRDAPDPTEANRIRVSAGSGVSRADLETLVDAGRDPYTFPDSFELFDWQVEAVYQWFANSRTPPTRGIAQVVTGAGKTVMALGAIREWLVSTEDGVVTIIVPTKVLMDQWLTELITKLNVPVEDLGWAGDGTRDGFEKGRRIVVSIVNTAVNEDYLAESLKSVGDPPHLLIADECHRYTGDVFSNIFSYHRTASLGLSATPTSNIGIVEKDCSEQYSPADELLISELGDIYYNLTYDEALKRGLIPPFEVNYVGFELTDRERRLYDQYTKKISNAINEIDMLYGDRLYQLNGNFHQKLQTLMNSADGPTPAIADFFEFTQERRDLVADSIYRQSITLKLLRNAVESGKKSIVFQEHIAQLEQLVAPHERRDRNPRTGKLTEGASGRQEQYELYEDLKQVDLAIEELFSESKFWPAMYHSGHSRDAWNDYAMEWFRADGFANVMLSVKALVEGVDVPSADVGIIRVSNSSLRQRIQTFGRVLRTGSDEGKTSQLYVLYARDTIDERLFKEYDWDEQLANAEVHHYYWDAGDSMLEGELVLTDDPLPTSDDFEVTIPDPTELEMGDPYPGPREGYQFSVDAQGRPFKERQNRREFITNPEIVSVAEFVLEQKGGGTIIINEANHMLTVTQGGPVFLGVTEGPDSFEFEEQSGSLTDDAPTELDFF